MLRRQRGISLIWVAVLMAGVAALAMAAIFSMRYERNLFAEGLARLTGKTPPAATVQGGAAAAAALAPSVPGNQLRRCVINGKTVFSDTECSAANATTQNVIVHETKGVEAPKAPKPDPAGAAPQDLRAKMIENAAR
jgi:Tfp pilus assembly protein PilV